MENKLPSEVKRTYQRKEKLTIAAEHADIVIPGFSFRIWIEKGTIYSEVLPGTEGALFHNEKQLSITDLAAGIPIKEGDTISFSHGSITLFDQEAVLCFPEGTYDTTLLEKEPGGMPFEGFPYYKRSPRLIKRITTEKIEISGPPEKKVIPKSSIVQIIVLPLVMLGVTVAVSLLMGRGIFVIVSAITTVASIAGSVGKYIKDKKECREHEKKRRELYDNHLLFKRKQIYRAREKEIDALTYNNPSVKDIERMVNEYSSRIYERGANDNDFLTVSIGTAKEPVSFPIIIQQKEMEMEKEELEKEGEEIKKNALMIEDKPVCIDLKQAHLGLVGEKDVIHEQLKLIVAQLTFFHSYYELEIINIFHDKYNQEFKWMNWYPHLRIHAINAYGCINNDRMRDHVLGSMHRIIKERKLRQEESKKDSRFLPHYLFIIDEPKLVADHAIMEYLDKEGDNLGFSIIYTTHMRANLPENIGTIVQLDSST